MDWFLGVLQGAFSSVWTLVVIAVPLVVLMEYMKHYNLLDKISRVLAKPFRLIGFRNNAVIPLLSGLIFGLVYGAALMINVNDSEDLPQEQMTGIFLFLAIFHSAIEDTFLFWRVGADISLMLGIRVVIAVIFVLVYFKFFAKKSNTLKPVEANAN